MAEASKKLATKKQVENVLDLGDKNWENTRSTTAVDSQHLKVKEYDISLTKIYHITISIKISSSIHIFIHKIRQVLGSHELKSHCHF